MRLPFFDKLLCVSEYKICPFLEQVQERFEVDIKELPAQIDTATYSKSSTCFYHM